MFPHLDILSLQICNHRLLDLNDFGRLDKKVKLYYFPFATLHSKITDVAVFFLLVVEIIAIHFFPCPAFTRTFAALFFSLNAFSVNVLLVVIVGWFFFQDASHIVPQIYLVKCVKRRLVDGTDVFCEKFD